MSWQDLTSKDLKVLESGFFADATITRGDRTWNVHKIIICRCEWFMKAFNSDFEEAKTSNVNISSEDFTPELVDAVITFIYSGSVDFEKLNTKNSVVDACVRLWAIADFFVLKELQNEAIKFLEKLLDNKLKVLCVVDEEDFTSGMTDRAFHGFLDQAFDGIKTAYTTYPHSLPCQQVLVSFFYAARSLIFGTRHFSEFMASAPREFSHEMFMATIDGRQSKWVMEEGSDFPFPTRKGGCTGCRSSNSKYNGRWAVDPSIHAMLQMVHWRCIPCHEKHSSEASSQPRQS